MRQYHYANIVEQHARNAKWRSNNAEKHKANSRKYYSEHKEQHRQSGLSWQRANKDKVAAANKKWEQANPESRRRRTANRRARLQKVFTGQITLKEIIKFYANPCFYCGSNKEITLDHIIPISKGGSHSIGNIVSACQSCNYSKHDKLYMEWRIWKIRQKSKGKTNG
jgi:5-methylcytosine-specific restriction endonuclease McrA